MQRDSSPLHGGEWSGPIFVLTHHPDDAESVGGVTFLNGDLTDAVDIARRAARGKNVEVLSPSIGKQLLELGLLDEIDLHVLPVLLGVRPPQRDSECRQQPTRKSRTTDALGQLGFRRARSVDRSELPLVT